MASNREYLEYVLEQLHDLDGISHRAMMGEFLLYYKGKLFGGIYDDRLLVKSVNAAVSYLSDPARVAPYQGAKEMLLVEQVDDSAYLCGLVEAMYEELPLPKGKK